MKTQTLRVSLGFARGSDSKLVEASEDVKENLYDNAVFDNPPVNLENLGASINTFITAMAMMAQGGTSATADKNNKRAALITLMKDLAFYVQMKSANDLATLLSSGFKAVSMNRASEILPPPDYVTVRNGVSRQSLTTVKPVKNARGYEMQYAPVDDAGAMGEWADAPFTSSSRNMPVGDLVSGKVYIYRVRAMGGLNGESDWSESVSHRAY